MPVFQIRENSTPERALVIAPEVLAQALACELHARGALCDMTNDINTTGALARMHKFDVVLVHARPDAFATVLLLRLLRAQQGAHVTIMLIVEPLQATTLGDMCLQADEIISVTLKPRRIIEATGLGLRLSQRDDIKQLA
jgi:DNA-binding response OmpR family regulator